MNRSSQRARHQWFVPSVVFGVMAGALTLVSPAYAQSAADQAEPITTPTQPSNSTTAHIDRLQGESRVETAVATAKDLYPNPITGVIVARSDTFADSVSAVPLAKAMGMPVLLTPSDQLHPATAAEIKRLLPSGGTAYLMGGQSALSIEVEQAINAITGKTERIAGENRADTAVKTAQRLKAMGNLNHLIYVDGTDWQPTLIAGPLAAKTKGALLLTWGEELAPESHRFMLDHPGLPETAVGDKAAVTAVKEISIVESDPTLLSKAVIDKFFPAPTAVASPPWTILPTP